MQSPVVIDPEIMSGALSLEAVTEEPHHHFSSFRVRGKIFVTIPPGEEFLHVFVDDQAREVALALYSEFIEKLLWGGKVVGVRVSLKAFTQWVPVGIAFGIALLAILYTRNSLPRKVDELRSKILQAAVAGPIAAMFVWKLVALAT
jgi:hypothetical protein